MAEIKGGKRLAIALARLSHRLGTANRSLAVGFLENATYPNGTPVAMIAAIQNYGAPRAGIPRRAFFSNMVKDKRAGWPATLAQLVKDNDFDTERALQLMGEGIKGQLQQSILDTNAPPLAPRTIARKGFDKPLIESSHMINSVDFEVS